MESTRSLLTDRAGAIGDPEFWRFKNADLTGQLDAARKKEERYKRELEEANKESRKWKKN